MSREASRPRVPRPGRLGLLDNRAAEWLDYLGWTDEDAVPVLWALSRAPDPDLALGALVRLHEALVSTGDAAADEFDSTLRTDATLRARLLGLVGSSTALGDHLVAEPHRWTLLRQPLPSRGDVVADLLDAVDAVPESPAEGAPAPTQSADLRNVGTYRAGVTGGAAVNLLRAAYRDHVVLLAAHDLAPTVEQAEPALSFSQVGRRLSDLADAALTAALAVAVATVHPDTPMPGRLGVVAMGKGGARELNYLSDVDVIFVAEPADAKTGRVAGEMMRIGSMAFFEVDAALVGSRVDVVFDPFDLTSVEIRFQGRSMGSGIPVVIGRHAHPQARPEAAPAPTPTGIDYLGLLAARRDAELAGAINYAQLAFDGSAVPHPSHTAPTDCNDKEIS